MPKVLIPELNKEIEYSEKYSLRDFTDKILIYNTDLDGLTIYASCFSKEISDTKVFPDNMTGVTFINCNLDNVFIPQGNTIIGGIRRKFKVQNDLEDWIIDNLGNPIEPVNKKAWLKWGLSIDPKDIPKDFIREEKITKSQYEKEKDTQEFLSWYKEAPQIVSSKIEPTIMDVKKDKWQTMLMSGDFTPFDAKPEDITSQFPKIMEQNEKMVLKGFITYLVIRGKGVIRQEGKISRPFENKSVSQIKRREMKLQ